MRAGMECLLGLLRDQPQPACVAESEWRNALAIAEEEKLLPWLAARTLAIEVPASVRAPLEEIRREAVREAFLCTATLKHLLSAFHECGIPVISLKGPWLAERLYGDAAIRSYGDLDLLVRPCDWEATEQLLFELGFSPCAPCDDRHRAWRRAGFRIEAHFRLANPLDFDLDMEAIWGRAQLSAFHGVPAWLPAPSDELLFLCIHAVGHGFERLRLLVDLSLGFRESSLPDAVACGRRPWELENVLALCWLLVKRLEGSPFSPAPSAAWLPALPRLNWIADRIWQQALLQPASPWHWPAIHRLYLEMEPAGRPRFLRRIRHARILFTRTIDRDYEFAARFHLRRTWQVWIFRQLRLLFTAAGLPLLQAKMRRKSSLLHESASAN